MRCYLLTLFFLMATAAMAVPRAICQRTTASVSIDGRLDEADWKQVQPLSALRDLSGKPTSFAASIYLMYDDHYLYVGAVLPEKNLTATLTERDSIIYHDDDFEIFIDPSCEGRNYLELELNQLNTVWDLFITAPYRDGKACVALHDWDIKGLKTAVSLQGTLNEGEANDTSWTVEVAWPWSSITGHSHLPRRGEPPMPGTEMRFNFSRVDHDGGVESNSVWAPTRQATIHAPEHWGRIRFSEKCVGTPETFPPEIGLWVHGNDATLTAEQVKAWSDAGVTTFVIDGQPDAIAKISAWGKTLGLKTVAWFWSLNRPEDAVALQHPLWYAVSHEGKRCHKKEERPFVPYYQFLCPSHPDVRTYLMEQVAQIAAIPTIDAVQLDYIRLPDVILPKALWKTYGLDMSQILPAYDFCYCEMCVSSFGRQPQATDPAWKAFRLNQVATVANLLADTVRQSGKQCGAAVFPTPDMAADMVYQDWSRFNFDFAFPMVYASFYGEDPAWIIARTQEARRRIVGTYPIYPGLHLPDLPPETLVSVIRELLQHNPEGVCLFSHETFSTAHQRALQQILHP